MCGIAGFVGRDIHVVLPQTKNRMASSILYRGRDEQGEWTDRNNVHLFHARLSIIDLSTGQQPMFDSSGRFVIVFNGEIYNYSELREEYEKKGAKFRTKSDTEVILEGFKLKKEKVCNDLNGMFAFCIWDLKEKRLFLARDHLGKKPLFYCFYDGLFYFASTLDAFSGIKGWNPKLSLAGFALFSILGGFTEEQTIYENAFSVPYASFGSVSPGQKSVSFTRFWRMDFSKKSKNSFVELLNEYEQILLDAIKIRLRSDVPLALTFSGGVDSGTIAALCAKKLNAPLRCYTIDYHTKEDPSEETEIAKEVAAKLGLDWEYIHFDYHHGLLDGLKETYSYYDQPCQQLALVYSHRLYEKMKPFATVVLSGNGSDELFTGYIGDEKIRQLELLLSLSRWTKPVARHLWPFFKNIFGSRLLKYQSVEKTFPYFFLPISDAFIAQMNRRSATAFKSTEVQEHLEATLQKIASEAAMANGTDHYMDFRMFLALMCSNSDANFRLPDISGLAAQVEVRSPYLDYRMVQFAAALPHRFKVGRLFNANFNKYLPKVYYRQWVPDRIAFSRKKGMGWNLRFDKSIAADEAYRIAFLKAYDQLDQQGIPSRHVREAFDQYCLDKKSGIEFSSRAGDMTSGFMLGKWLENQQNIR